MFSGVGVESKVLNTKTPLVLSHLSPRLIPMQWARAEWLSVPESQGSLTTQPIRHSVTKKEETYRMSLI